MSLLAQDERLTRRVGAVSLVVIALAIVFFVFIFDRIEWGSHIRLKVYFHTTGGLREGAAFVVAGTPVGHIETIGLVPRGAKTPLGGDEGVVVKVAIDSDAAARIMYGGDVFVASRGALSGKYLEIGPAPQPGRALRDGDEILGRDPPSLDRVLQRTWDNLTMTAKFADEVRPEWIALMAEVTTLRTTLDEIAPGVELRADIGALIDEARRTYAALGGEAGLDRIDKVAERGGDTIAQARQMIATLRTSADVLSASVTTLRARLGTRGAQVIEKVELAIDRVRKAIDKVDPLLAQVQALQAHIARGDGSLLKLMNDPEFPEDAKELGKILKRQPWKILDRPPK
jgi:phospholipid/cholesterol/gamma-HCH transport system substrate-binding protein